ncbi:hypothetical protein AQUCO_00300491v1 [Aquilegia coerulea]|uniref:3'-5' exonuclease domain-containing protein n=1 Tax=Aquilegia coerulea TaxID=218851 RepID=A0A2G5EZ50_AQUCA|nr:hypothetical protein AQUCO_00300491v1 [Aquilegia coerulea]
MIDITIFDNQIHTFVTSDAHMFDHFFVDFVSNPRFEVDRSKGHLMVGLDLISAPEIPEILAMFLSCSEVKFVGVGIQRDVEKLMQQMNRSELRYAVLKDLAREVLGLVVEKPKRITVSRWDAPQLTFDQIQYASIDAYLSFEIGKMLMISGN